MKPIEIIAQDLFDKVRSRFSNLQMGDDNGAVTANPPDARFFDFDFVIEGNNLGRVSISINDTGNLKIFFSQGITEDADDATQGIWYDFLKEMRFFAKRRLMRFDTRDITKDNLDKTDFQYLAQTGPKDNNMTESQMFGSSKTSKRKVGETLLILRHEGEIDPSIKGARSRKIKNIFIQNAEGERFKLPMAWLPLGRALQRHVYHGGYPHDECGQDMIETAGQCHQLSNFYKHVSRKTPSMNPDALNIAEKVSAKLKSLRHHMESLANEKYYEAWKESFTPVINDATVLDDATMESYKDTFTVRGFDESLVDAFPLVHAIMQEAGEVDLNALVSEAHENDCTECGMPESRCECDEGSTNEDFDAFESWADSVVEGTIPNDVMIELKNLLAGDLPSGASGELVSTLQGILKDANVDNKEELFNTLNSLSPNEDQNFIKQTIISVLGKDDENLTNELTAAAQGQQPAPQQPAPPEAQLPAPGAEVPQQEPAMAEDRAMKIEGLKDKISKLTAAFGAKKKSTATSSPAKGTDIADTDAKMKRLGQRGPDYSESVAAEGIYQDLGSSGKEIYNQVQALRDEIRSGKIDRETAETRFKELLDVPGVDPTEVEKEWHRITGQKDEPILDPKYRKSAPSDDDKFVADLKQKTGFDSDEKNLRNQIAKHGSFQSGDSGFADEDSLDPEVDPDSQLIEPEAEKEKPKQGTPEEIAKSIIGFFNREDGTWTKGRPGIVAHVTREFGDEAGKLATQLIMKLSKDTKHHDDMAEMRRLAGMAVNEADAWKKETPWKKITKKDPRGVVTNLSDKARRETEKADKESKKK